MSYFVHHRHQSESGTRVESASSEVLLIMSVLGTRQIKRQVRQELDRRTLGAPGDAIAELPLN